MERDAGLLQGTLDETVEHLQGLLKESEACKVQLSDELALLSVCLNSFLSSPLYGGMITFVASTPQVNRMLWVSTSLNDTTHCLWFPSFSWICGTLHISRAVRIFRMLLYCLSGASGEMVRNE